MKYKMILEDKKTLLTEIENLSISELWKDFLTIQVDLFFNKEYAIFSDRIWWEKANNILELGCSNGYFTYKLLKQEPNKNFVAIDINPRNIEYAKEHFSQKNVSYENENCEKFIEKYENQFDIIIFRMRLQHLKDPLKALAHVFRYLKPEGRVIIIDSYDSLREISYPTPYLDSAIKQMNQVNSALKKGNRFVTFEIQKNIINQSDDLFGYYELEESNLTESGSLNPLAKDLIIQGDKERDLYFMYNILFFKLLKKHWEINIDFDKAYAEAKHFQENQKSWLRSGKQYLLLKKKNL